MPTATQGVQDMGSVEVKKGGPAAAFKSSPTVKVAVTEVSEATATAGSSTR
jgi:hypothetical protein